MIRSALVLLSLIAPAGQPPAPPPQLSPELLACAPMALPEVPMRGIRVEGGFIHGQHLFGPGETLVVNAGTAQGLRAGQVYYTRRQVRDHFTPATPEFTPISIHTSGWVTIVEARATSATATVTHACDGVVEGDYLEPFSAPVIPAPAAVQGAPDYEHPGHVVMGDERRQTGFEGMLMVIDRGTDQGLRAGQTLTIFRSAARGEASFEVGDATVMSVQPRTSLIRIDRSHDAVYLGDLVAVHRLEAAAGSVPSSK